MLEMERGKEKMTFVSWGTSLTKFEGKAKDNICFIKLPKIWFSCQFPSSDNLTQHGIGGCLKVMAEMQDAEKCYIFVTRCQIFFFPEEISLLLHCTFLNSLRFMYLSLWDLMMS